MSPYTFIMSIHDHYLCQNILVKHFGNITLQPNLYKKEEDIVILRVTEKMKKHLWK